METASGWAMWVQAGASIATCLAFVFAGLAFFADRRERIRQQASLVHVWIDRKSQESGTSPSRSLSDYVVKIWNGSPSMIYDLSIQLRAYQSVAPETEPSGPQRETSAEPSVKSVTLQFKTKQYIAPASAADGGQTLNLEVHSMIWPSEVKLRDRERLLASLRPSDGSNHLAFVTFTFRDAAGRKWLRNERGVLERFWSQDDQMTLVSSSSPTE